MTNEEKRLLLKVLCDGLLYGIKVEAAGWDDEKEGEVLVPVTVYSINQDGYIHFCDNAYDITYCRIEECCPYLRPMSSMTEEEFLEYYQIKYNKVTYRNGYERIDVGKFHNVGIIPIEDYLDWLNAHHFDYRGLIEKGLALEAPEGMYKNE